MIQLFNIKKTFNMGKPNEFVAIEGINMVIDSQKVTILKGPSGSGKTTLLSLIGCMARPTAGRIMLRNREITSLPERFLTDIRRHTFGFIFQQFQLIKGVTVLENVMIPAYPIGISHSSLKEKAMALLDLFDIPNKASSKVEWLSGGEMQRVTIARALINDPTFIVADEPTAHLDSKLSVEFMEIVRKLKEKDKTIVIASHDPIVHESEAVDRVIEMRDGKIIESREASDGKQGKPAQWPVHSRREVAESATLFPACANEAR
ncbi:MAG: ABC transporter ATP-binding protein [Thermodesulfobacteriota bacterium]